MAGVTLAVVAAHLRVVAFRAALERVLAGTVTPGVRVGGVPAEEAALREALDAALRALVPLTDDPDERVRLIDEARGVRAWSWT